MKNRTVLFFFLCIFLFSAHQLCAAGNQDEKDQVFNSDIPEFSSVQEQDKWRNESAVVLAQYTYFSFELEMFEGQKKTVVHERNRKRVKLNDQLAVESFSQFYFNSSSNDKHLRIVKKNGQIVDVDMTQLIGVDAVKVKSARKSKIENKYTYQKIAIPNLEVGDIIDSYYHTKTFLGANIILLNPIKTAFREEYPVAYQKININFLDPHYYLLYRNYNEAPALKLLPGYVDANRCYELVMRNQEKYNEEAFSNADKDIPFMTFQILRTTFGFKDAYGDHFFSPDRGTVSAHANEEVIKKVLCKEILRVHRNYKESVKLYYPYIMSRMRLQHKAITDPKEYMEKAYYIFRSLVGGKSLSDYLFYAVWKKIAKSKKWTFDLGVALPDNFDDITQIVALSDLEFFPIVNGVKIFNFNFNDEFGYKPMHLVNGRLYRFSFTKIDLPTYLIELPKDKHSPFNNVSYHGEKIDFNLEQLKLNVIDTMLMSGFYKSRYSNWVFKDVNLRVEDSKQTGVPYNNLITPAPQRSGANLKRQQERDRIEREHLEKKRQEKLSLIKDLCASEGIKTEKVDSFELLQHGRFRHAPQMKFVSYYSLTELLSKMGNNYVVKVGALFNPPLKFSDIQNRNTDIHYAYNGVENYCIKMVIPDGYKISGHDKLNIKLDHELLSFESIVNESNGVLTINVEVVFKSAYIPVEQAEEVRKFLDQISVFYDGKVLLKML